MQRTTKTAEESAGACYAERHVECQDLPKRVASRLVEHCKQQAQEPANWGYAETQREDRSDLPR